MLSMRRGLSIEYAMVSLRAAAFARGYRKSSRHIEARCLVDGRYKDFIVAPGCLSRRLWRLYCSGPRPISKSYGVEGHVGAFSNSGIRRDRDDSMSETQDG